MTVKNLKIFCENYIAYCIFIIRIISNNFKSCCIIFEILIYVSFTEVSLN